MAVKLFLIIFASFSLALSQAGKTDLRLYLPSAGEFINWQCTDTARIYDEATLFDLIDGGADMYLEYGFRQVISAEYKYKEKHSVMVEIYEMCDDASAFGIYSLNIGTQGKDISLGNEGKLYNHYLMFWKNRFLVFISSEDTTHETALGISSMAKMIDQKLGHPGKKPALLADLPPHHLTTAKYFKGMLGFSSLYTFDVQNIFAMKNGVMGDYSDHRVFILEYNSEKETEDNFFNAQKSLKSGSRFSDYRLSGKRASMFDQQGAQLCLTYLKNIIVVIIARKDLTISNICDNIILFIKKR